MVKPCQWARLSLVFPLTGALYFFLQENVKRANEHAQKLHYGIPGNVTKYISHIQCSTSSKYVEVSYFLTRDGRFFFMNYSTSMLAFGAISPCAGPDRVIPPCLLPFFSVLH